MNHAPKTIFQKKKKHTCFGVSHIQLLIFNSFVHYILTINKSIAIVINHLMTSTIHTIIYEENKFYGQHQPIVGIDCTIHMDESLIALSNGKYAITPHIF